MKASTAKSLIRAQQMLNNLRALLQELDRECASSSSSDFTPEDATRLQAVLEHLSAGETELSPLATRANEETDQSTLAMAGRTQENQGYRFNADQKIALTRLAKGDEVLWMQNGTAFDSLAKRQLVRVGFDEKGRPIAVLTEVGMKLMKHWKD